MPSTTPPASLAATHQRTFEAIFRHPISHNLAWRDVFALFRHLGQVAEETNGNLKITRNGQTLVLPPPRQKDITEAAELVTLRHFIQRSDVSPAPAANNATPAHWLLVIDHHEARIFRSDAIGASAQQLLPHPPEDFFRHARNSKDFARGREKPEPNSFFGPVAKALHGAEKILIFGSGKGTASEM